ncbi:MAG: squalene synthase HpnC [Verrucomicrobiota bacterium]
MKQTESLESAYGRCSKLAKSHYENFPVGLFVPKHLQKHVHAVYAFARVSDDIADEGYSDPRVEGHRRHALSEAERSEQMAYFREQLRRCLEGQLVEPTYQWIFLPLQDTINKCQLPAHLFYDLLSAFQQDIEKRRYANIEEVLDYCRRSANPIGRLVLHLHGIRDEELHILSDHICTGLQLANFWQDISVDLGKDRIYLPQDALKKHWVEEDELFSGVPGMGFTACVKEQVQLAQEHFDQGRPLLPALACYSGKLAWEIRMTWLGGTTILEKIRRRGYDTLSKRPKLSKFDFVTLFLKSFIFR